MAMTEHLRRQHAEIIDLIRRIEPLLEERKAAASAERIRGMLSSLTDKLALHLSLEDDILYPMLARSPQPRVRDLAKAFMAEMGQAAPQVQAFSAKWDAAAIAAEPARFCADATSLFALLDDRILRENRDLYPLADRAAQSTLLCQTP